MDEPLSNLDAKLRVTMRSELKRFHISLQTTTVYVTHDQLEAMTMSDRIAVMDRGVIQQFGTPQEIYNHPSNLFVAGFIGSPPMNVIEGVHLQDGRLYQRASGTSFVLPIGSLERFGRTELAGRDLVVGIRPQNVRVNPQPDPGAPTGKIELIELVGSEKLLEIILPGGVRLTAEVYADLPVQPRQEVGVEFDVARVHLFDARTQHNVLQS